MRVSARMTSKGQVTVPKAVRELLELKAGDELVFDVDEAGVHVGRTTSFVDLAGSVAVPPRLRGASWKRIEELAAQAWTGDAP